MTLQPELSVVLPCLNEAETLAGCLETIRSAIQESGMEAEVIVADNGSTDGSQQIAEAGGARVIHVLQKGYGSALMGGITAARGKYVLMGDADGQHDFSQLKVFVEQLRHGYDLVMGNRFRGGVEPGAMPPLNRYLGNPALTRVGRIFFRARAGDFHCGLRAFSRAAYERMGLRTTGMEFASEMVVKASLLGLRVAEVPTRLFPHGRSRPPHLRPFYDGWRHLRFMLLYSPRWLFLYPGSLLTLLGLAVGAWLLPGPRRVAGVTVDVHSLIYAAAAVLIGFQAVAFAVFTKVFAITEGLLPPDPRMDRMFRIVNLERGLLVGATLLALGIAGSVYAFHTIRLLNTAGGLAFDIQDARLTLRLIVPAALALTLGFEVVLASFFLSVLGLARK